MRTKRILLLIAFNGAHGPRDLELPLSEKFGVEVSIIDAPMPQMRIRSGQGDADDVLSEVCRLRVGAKADLALGVTDVDLYVPDLNFVFGLASQDGACAVVSSNRLKGDGQTMLRERLVKEAVHELGHVSGLGHCDDPRCVMHFSNSLMDTDVKSDGFCSKCSSLLA